MLNSNGLLMFRLLYLQLLETVEWCCHSIVLRFIRCSSGQELCLVDNIKMYSFICVSMHMCLSMWMWVFICIYTSVGVWYAWLHIYMCDCMLACADASVYAWVWLCEHVCAYMGIRVNDVCASACMCVQSFMCSCASGCADMACVRLCIHAGMYISLSYTWPCVFMHVFLHVDVFMSTHGWNCLFCPRWGVLANLICFHCTPLSKTIIKSQGKLKMINKWKKDLHYHSAPNPPPDTSLAQCQTRYTVELQRVILTRCLVHIKTDLHPVK